MKTLRHRLALAVAGAAALALSACGGDTEAPQTSATSTAPASSAASATETSTAAPDPAAEFCAQAKVTGPGVKEIGEEKAKQAYCEIIESQINHAFVYDLVTKPMTKTKWRKSDFAAIREHLTAGTRGSWDEKVKQIVSGNIDRENFGDIYGLMFFGLTNPDYEYYPESSGEPLYRNLAFSPARTKIERSPGYEPELALTFTISFDLNMIEKKTDSPVLFPVDKALTLHLIENSAEADMPWLIDSWKSRVHYGTPRPADVESTGSN